jgi:hypothetical protein
MAVGEIRHPSAEDKQAKCDDFACAGIAGESTSVLIFFIHAEPFV